MLVDDSPVLESLAAILRQRHLVMRVNGLADAAAYLEGVEGRDVAAIICRHSAAATAFLEASITLAPRSRRVVVLPDNGDRAALENAVRRGLVDFLLHEPLDEVEVRLAVGQLAKLMQLEADNAVLRQHVKAQAFAPSLGGGSQTYHAQMPALVGALLRDHALACLFIDLSQLRSIEREFGLALHGLVIQQVGEILGRIRSELLRADDLLCASDDGDALMVFLAPGRSAREHTHDALDGVTQRIDQALQAALTRELSVKIPDQRRIAVGSAQVLYNPMVRAERLVSRLVTDARAAAGFGRQRQLMADRAIMQELILGGDGLRQHYQPIVHLESGDVFGYEALTRGPQGTRLESPAVLFNVADELSLLYELDRACAHAAVRGAGQLSPVHRVFINRLPQAFHDPTFLDDDIPLLLEETRLSPANLVFEITEQLAIANLDAFRRRLAAYTQQGFGIAIDDVGTKHSNLEAVMALRPNFIKLSDVLTRGAAKSVAKREMLKSLLAIGQAIDAVVVAEGIETSADLVVLRSLGVKYGQGYFLAMPGEAFPPLRDIAVSTLRELARHPPADVLPPVEYDEESGEFRTVMTRAAAFLDASRASPPTGDVTSDFVDEHFKTVPGPGVEGKPTGTG
jgi:EAL domain-containing protein (putative c-di-GMP-specific phosphodiesterase class I)